jgi:NADH dehydrogenase
LVPVISGADVVINLVGSFDHMAEVQEQGAKALAEAAKRAKVSAFVHISAIGADVESASRYGQTKGAGEAAVLAAFSKATIMRPSLIFGAEDAFTNRFAALMRMMPLLPVLGGRTRFQPVFVGDVARAIAVAAAEPQTFGGQIYELGGPDTLSMLEINQWLARETRRDIFPIELPDVVASAIATLTGWLPGAPITRDQWLMLQSDNVVGANAKGLADLGITPVAMESVAPAWLTPYRKHGRFSEKAGAA